MKHPPVIHSLTRAEMEDLERAKALLENPGFAVRLTNLIGAPVEKGFDLLPKGWSGTVHKAAKAALMKALQVAVMTMGKRRRPKSREFLHKVMVGASGGIGGVFGLAALPVELPVSTAIMLRSIADIARNEGHNISLMTTKLACLEVFAFGGPTRADDAADSAYWVTRAALSKTVSDAASYLTQKGAVDVTAPALIRLINNIAARFGVIVSEEVAAKALPLIGAASGSVINVLFIDHFQNMARGHFIVKRLEARYGLEKVRNIYQDLAV